jgi:putative hydrolase of the HAD superfamily
MTIEAVTFDFHNTIAICDDWFQLEIRELVPELLRWHQHQTGRDNPIASAEDALKTYRILRQDIMEHGRERDAIDCAMYVLKALDVYVPETVVREGVEALMRQTLPGSHPVTGVVDAIRTLSARGVRLGVISNAVYHPFLEWSLTKFGVLDCFDVVVTSASAGYYKSRPELYRGTLERLGTQAECSVHIGDSCRFDVLGARAAGMRTVHYAPGEFDRVCDEADLQLASLVGLADTLFDHFGGEPT